MGDGRMVEAPDDWGENCVLTRSWHVIDRRSGWMEATAGQTETFHSLSIGYPLSAVKPRLSGRGYKPEGRGFLPQNLGSFCKRLGELSRG